MRTLLYIFGFSLLTLAPFLVTYAQIEYIPIAQIPFAPQGKMTAEGFATAAYRLAIMVAAMLAVIKIIYGGVQWMLTDVVTSKQNAIKDIRGAIIGLIIVLSAVFILEVINPNLKTFSLFRGAPAINVAPPASNPAAVDRAPAAPPPVDLGNGGPQDCGAFNSGVNC